jgi:hypothetical protein
LVPTGTPFSTDRQLEAERGHFGPATHSSTANDSTAGISIGLLNVRYALIAVGAVLVILAAALIVRQPGIPA